MKYSMGRLLLEVALAFIGAMLILALISVGISKCSVQASVPVEPDVEEQEPFEPDACQCIDFVKGENDVTGTLCRCDSASDGVRWLFEGTPEGLGDLQSYLGEAVKQYHHNKLRQRWPGKED